MVLISFRLILLFPLLLLILGTAGCTGSGAGRNSAKTDDVYGTSQDEDDDDSNPDQAEETVEDDGPDGVDPETKARRQREESLTPRQREHRQSMKNMGSWVISAMLGIGLNLILALLLWG